MSRSQHSPTDALVTFLIGQPTAVLRLLAEHIDDGRGGCRACPIGARRGHHPWP